MAVAKKGDLGSGASVKTLKGFYVKSWLGRYVIAKSPTFTKAPSPSQLHNRNQFTITARMAASPLWLDQIAAMNASVGTEQVPRDILVMAAYGNYISFVLPDGTESTVADHGYQPPFTPQGRKTMLCWATNADTWNTNYSSAAFAFKGSAFVPTIPIKVTGIEAIANWVNGGRYRALIAIADVSGKITSIISQGDLIAGQTGQYVLRWPLVFELPQNARIVIMVGRIDLTATYAFPSISSGNQFWQFPINRIGYARMASINPSIGQTIDLAQGMFSTPIALEMEF